MNVLIVYNRDIDLNDAGASRTTIELANYLAEKTDIVVFVTFKILSGNNGKVLEVPIKDKTSVQQYKDVIENNKINCVIVPESEKLTEIIYRAKGNNKIRIISALHSRPGYERIRMHVDLFEDLLFNTTKFVDKLKILCHILLFPIEYGLRTSKMSHILHNAYIYSDYMVLLSEKYKNIFQEIYKTEDNGNKIVAIPNGLSFGNETISKDEYDRKQNICLFVGRLDEKSKRVSYILDIWKELEKANNGWKLVIVGSGRSEKFYRHLTKKYGLKNISFEGHQEPKDYYKKAKIFFMSSAYEGQPMTLLEALPMGCVPIVINDFESASDMIDNGINGYLVDSKKEFIDKSNLIMNDSHRIREMAENGITSCQKFDRNKTYEKYYSLIVE